MMRGEPDPVGPENDATILHLVTQADQIICGWGSHGAHLNRGAQMEALLRGTNRPLLHLGLTQAGHPKHPLYIGYARQPEPWA